MQTEFETVLWSVINNNSIEILSKVKNGKTFYIVVYNVMEGEHSSLSDENWFPDIEEAMDHVPLDVWLKYLDATCTPKIWKAIANKLEDVLDDLHDSWFHNRPGGKQLTPIHKNNSLESEFLKSR